MVNRLIYILLNDELITIVIVFSHFSIVLSGQGHKYSNEQYKLIFMELSTNVMIRMYCGGMIGRKAYFAI
jgi:hypothetical protein